MKLVRLAMISVIAGTATVATAQIPAGAPKSQADFCQIIATADAEYEPARKAWYAETNGIVQDRMTVKLNEMRNKRDQAVLSLIGASAPRMVDWRLAVRKVEATPIAEGGKTITQVTLVTTPMCDNDVTMTSEFDLTDALADTLAKLKTGDLVIVSARFLAHDAGRNSAARALDWDPFEGYAMASPSYRIALEQLRPAH
jgi:hypothetical protein